jgi:hypothetical protein
MKIFPELLFEADRPRKESDANSEQSLATG